MPGVCLITFWQTLGNWWVLQLHHACGLMRFLNPMLWNCHSFFVRKRLPCEYCRLKIWGVYVLIIILYNYRNTIDFSYMQQLFSEHSFSNACEFPSFCLSSEHPWEVEKWQALLPSSLTLRNNGFLIKREILKWIDQYRFSFLVDGLTTVCSLLCLPFFTLLYCYHSLCIHSFWVYLM